MNSLSFYSSEKVLILSSFFKVIFARHGNSHLTGVFSFFFFPLFFFFFFLSLFLFFLSSNLNISSHCFLACKFPPEKSYKLTENPLYKKNCFSLAVYKILSVFDFEWLTYNTSWCGSLDLSYSESVTFLLFLSYVFSNLESFLPLFLQVNSLPPFCLHFLESHNVYIGPLDGYKSLGSKSFFSIIFPFGSSDSIISVTFVHIHWFFLLPVWVCC